MAESPTEHFEHAEHAEHVAHMSDSFLTTVSITIAVLAVLAAGVGSLETIETAGVTVAKNEAVLFQTKASDNWAYYQAKSLKKNMYEIAAANGGPKAEEYLKVAQRYDDEQKKIEKDAHDLEARSKDRLTKSEGHEHRHHILTGAATLLHVSIAIATIAIITKGHRWPWYCAILLGLAGLVTAGYAYLPVGHAHH
jgi:hypothetical protein